MIHIILKLIFFAILIIGFFIDFLMMGFLHNLIIKFFKALPLFIKDIIRSDKGVFRGYGFWVFCGLGGSGKTISIVEYLSRIKEKFPNVVIKSNFDLSIADGKIEGWKDLLQTTNINTYEISIKEFDKRMRWGQKHIFMALDSNNTIHYYKTINDGVIFAFDEIQLTFESTNWQDAPENLLDYISQQRKLHKQIVSSSQVFTRINKKLREQTNFVIECSSVLRGRLVVNRYYRTVEYIANDEKMDKGSRKRKVKKRYCYIATDSIRKKYNTEQIMKDLEKQKNKESVLINLIKEVGENSDR